MEFSRQADYAVRAIVELSHRPEGELLHSSEIACNQDIPERYLPTIIRTLARAGIIRTLRGSHGGVSLTNPPADITLREVVEAIDGPLLMNRCQLQPGECRRDNGDKCDIHVFWENLAQDILNELEGVDFSELANAVSL